jgi:ketosteroid isomerase-like protein
MSISRPIEIVRALYDALATGDVAACAAALDPRLEWIEAAGFPLAGTYRGPQAVLDGVLARLAAEWIDFRTVPDEFVDGGDTVVALGLYSGTYRATGRRFEAPFAHVWRLAGGKVTRYVQYTDTVLVQHALQS